MSVHPISFSINSSKIVDIIPMKKKLLAFIEPGNISTYIYDNEEDYYNDYKESFFAITKKKAGWDCMRHYEILANGCIPLFLDIEKCPKNTMTHFPKEIVIEAMKLYSSMKNGENNNSICYKYREEYKNLYYKYLSDLLEYTKNNLTNVALSKYVLEKSNKSNVKKILFLSGDIGPDYLRCVTLCGFKETFGEDCHDYPRIPHLYKDFENPKTIYGKGISYTKLLSEDLHNNKNDIIVTFDIENHSYDIVIYGSYHRGLPFWDLVNKFYKPNEIILLCGEDEHNCDYKFYTAKGYDVFVRELI